jgi:hypothetical protein
MPPTSARPRARGGSVWFDWLGRTKPARPAAGEPGGWARGARAPPAARLAPVPQWRPGPPPAGHRRRPRCRGWCRSGRSTRPDRALRPRRGPPPRFGQGGAGAFHRRRRWSAPATSCSPRPAPVPDRRESARAEVGRAEARLLLAEQQLQRSAPLVRQRFAPESEMDTRRSALRERRPASPPPAPRCAKRSSTWSSPRSAPRARAASATAAWTRATSSSRARR